jgi:hypothetical protein
MLIPTVVMGKLDGSVELSQDEMDEEVMQTVLNRLPKYKYLPDEFLLDIIVLYQDRNYFYPHEQNYEFKNGFLTGKVVCNNGWFSLDSLGSVNGLIRRNETGHLIDSIIRSNKFALINSQYKRMNETAIGFNWSLLGNEIEDLRVENSRRDFLFKNQNDSVFGGYFNQEVSEIERFYYNSAETLNGVIVSCSGYRLKPYFGIYLFYPGLEGEINGGPFVNPQTKGNIEAESLPYFKPHTERGRQYSGGGSSKYYYIDNFDYKLLSKLHYGVQITQQVDGKVANENYYGDSLIKTCISQSDLKWLQNANDNNYFCTFGYRFGLNLPYSYKDIFRKYIDDIERKGYFINEIYFINNKSYLSPH